MSTIRRAAGDALAALSRPARDAGTRLITKGALRTWTVLVRDEGETHSVLCELNEDAVRASCTCAVDGCPHVAAVLEALSSASTPPHERPSAAAGPSAEHAADTDEAEPSPRPPAEDDPESKARPPSAKEPAADPQQLAVAITALTRECCRLGLEEPSEERDRALERVLELLRDRDMPDARRAVATLRRELGSAAPDAAVAGTALIRLTRVGEALRRKGPSAEKRAWAGLPEGAERREEVRLLEVARDSQRTPYGDRRDVSYFIDLEGGQLFREHAASKPGHAPRMSEGPFPKRLIGNLVAIESGYPPRRIRMLQYTSAGLAGRQDLERIRSAALTEVDSLYEAHGRALASHDSTLAPVVIFAPRKAMPSPRGVVLADRAGRLLPLARLASPAACDAVDRLGRHARLAAVVGTLVLGPKFLSILPLSVLVDAEGSVSLRQLR